jgi:hypothetical protein
MAKVRAPLLSFGASGTIAKTQTYADWRGIPYARQRVEPANPNTEGQQLTRGVFAMLNGLWRLASSDFQAPWTANAKGRPYTNRNKFIGMNTKLLRPETDMAKFVGSPGALGGIVAEGLVLAMSGSDVTATLTAPAVPTGWSLSSAVGVLIHDAAPDALPSFVSVTETKTPEPWVLTFPDPDAGNYIVSAWFTYVRPDLQTAYGPSLTDQITVA